MDIAPVARSAVSDSVFAHLVDEILSGRVAVDDALPSERELALAFAVNRHAIREALKRLQQARLMLATRPGDVTGVSGRVGYDSPSQFSREYRRQFGASPSQDAARLRDLGSGAAMAAVP